MIHLLLPFAGLLFYIWLTQEMRNRQVENPPAISLFVIFATWGAFIILVLTRFFWYWSGMATLGLFYLVLVAPVVMLVIAVKSWLDRKQSGFHLGAFVASLCYAPIMIAALVTSKRWGIPFK